MNKLTRILTFSGLIAGLLMAAATASLAAKPVNKKPNANSKSVITAEPVGPLFTSVVVTSTKELSNVVMMFCGGAVEKVEFVDEDSVLNLDGLWEVTVSGSGDFLGAPIASVWVKSGSYRSGDGPGYGGMIAFMDTCGGGETLS